MPTLLGSEVGVLGQLWSQNDAITSWLKVTSASNCFSHPYYIYTSVWAHWFAVHGHTVAVSNSYTHTTTWLRFRGSGSLMESKQCHHIIMTVLPTSISDIYTQKDWSHWYADHGHTSSALNSYTYTHATCGSKVGVLGHLWSQIVVITSWFSVTASSNWFPHLLLKTYTKWLSTLICSPWENSSSLKKIYPHYYLAQMLILGLWVTCAVKTLSLRHFLG